MWMFSVLTYPVEGGWPCHVPHVVDPFSRFHNRCRHMLLNTYLACQLLGVMWQKLRKELFSKTFALFKSFYIYFNYIIEFLRSWPQFTYYKIQIVEYIQTPHRSLISLTSRSAGGVEISHPLAILLAKLQEIAFVTSSYGFFVMGSVHLRRYTGHISGHGNLIVRYFDQALRSHIPLHF